VAWSTVRARPAQRSRNFYLDIEAASACTAGGVMSGTALDTRRAYILAEFRCALIKAKLAQLDIEAVACALRDNIITVDQAVAAFWDSEAVHFLGLELNEAA